MRHRLSETEVDARFTSMNVKRLEPYIHSHNPILIQCQNGHQIKRTPAHVWRGIGCRACNGTDSPTQDQAKKKFADRGFELLGTYINSVTHVLTRCRCGHEWNTRPVCIITLGTGCPVCSYSKAADRYRLPESKLSDRLKDSGIILLEPYKNALTKMLMRGPCGHEWRARLGDVFGGTGCKQCAANKPVTQDEAVKRYTSVGLEMLEPYKNTQTRCMARCDRCDREWLSMPKDIFAGHGCSKCAPRSFRFDKPGTLYYVRVSNPFGDPVYKIGITNKTLRQRFKRDFSKINIIETWHFSNGAEAFEMEQDILSDHDADRYEGSDILMNGNDELFKFDVLGLDAKDKGQLELVA